MIPLEKNPGGKLRCVLFSGQNLHRNWPSIYLLTIFSYSIRNTLKILPVFGLLCFYGNRIIALICFIFKRVKKHNSTAIEWLSSLLHSEQKRTKIPRGFCLHFFPSQLGQKLRPVRVIAVHGTMTIKFYVEFWVNRPKFSLLGPTLVWF